jgi:hypothetical protein
MKQKERGFNKAATLGPGWAYFVEPSAFAKEIERVTGSPDIHEKSTCESTFSAIERANSRMNQGFAVTGVVAAVDSRGTQDQYYIQPL